MEKEKKQTTNTDHWIDRVYELVRQIPRGKVSSYGAIAEASGMRTSSRMVGWAMNKSGSAWPPVPAHRVVNRKGELSGRHFFATPTLMQELLEAEGIVITDQHRVLHLENHYWIPDAQNKIP